jgi:hypothetical protein
MTRRDAGPGRTAEDVPAKCQRPPISPAIARRPRMPQPVLAGQQVVQSALDYLARIEAYGLFAWTPPVAGRLPASLAGPDVIPGRVSAQAAVPAAGPGSWDRDDAVGDDGALVGALGAAVVPVQVLHSSASYAAAPGAPVSSPGASTFCGSSERHNQDGKCAMLGIAIAKIVIMVSTSPEHLAQRCSRLPLIPWPPPQQLASSSPCS